MAKKKAISKKQASKIHFKKAVQDRLNADINRHDIRELVKDINEHNNVLKTERLSNRVNAVTMNFLGTKCVILFDRIRNVPITVLTMDMSYESYSGSCSSHGMERIFR